MSPEEVKIPNATPMSVKDRAKHLNKMASETDIHSSKGHKHERVCEHSIKYCSTDIYPHFRLWIKSIIVLYFISCLLNITTVS